MIAAKELSRVFGQGENAVHALRNVSLQIAENEFVAVMGSSGSGKSTLMNILGCLDTPSSGSYQLDNQLIGQLDDISLSAMRNRPGRGASTS
ncbi:ATP-binding cassette domain-containing protein [Rheinheimera baltica]|uniref:ATP-binding cassette domain-containing protein n=1 Tax=Rheinheimera baltica TaxID=67576 RepID=A0ABT9I1Z6_9GAMM|nr:ATP-binding cassette domain-containing protein [Rheinheimera baltica]MDP5137387.1 ATP-binding cassette domain-containing protein [Rheinheimera baltica]